MFNKNKIKLFFILLLLQAGIVLSQTVTFSYADGEDYYNLLAKDGNNGAAGGDAGGIMVEGSGMANLIYTVEANFNDQDKMLKHQNKYWKNRVFSNVAEGSDESKFVKVPAFEVFSIILGSSTLITSSSA